MGRIDLIERVEEAPCRKGAKSDPNEAELSVADDQGEEGVDDEGEDNDESCRAAEDRRRLFANERNRP